MKLMMFGATGKTGVLFVNKALEEGYEVTAYVRNPAKMTMANDKLTIIEGSVLDLDSVTTAMKGQDVVVSCLGGDDNNKSTVLTDMTKVITEAMKQTQVTRIVYTSTAGIHDEFSLITNIIVKMFYGNAIKDHKGAVKHIMVEGIDYTIARPLSLVDGPRKGNYREAMSKVPKGGKNISREDLADFLMKAVTESKYINQSVGLAY